MERKISTLRSVRHSLGDIRLPMRGRRFKSFTLNTSVFPMIYRPREAHPVRPTPFRFRRGTRWPGSGSALRDRTSAFMTVHFPISFLKDLPFSLVSGLLGPTGGPRRARPPQQPRKEPQGIKPRARRPGVPATTFRCHKAADVRHRRRKIVRNGPRFPCSRRRSRENGIEKLVIWEVSG